MKIILLVLTLSINFIKIRKNKRCRNRKLGGFLGKVGNFISGKNKEQYKFYQEDALSEILHQSEKNSQLRQIVYIWKELTDRVDELKTEMLNSFNEINSMLDRSSLSNNIPLVGGIN